jgi:hypothetical protein
VKKHFCLTLAFVQLLMGTAITARAETTNKTFLRDYDKHWFGVFKLKTMFAWLKTNPSQMFQEMRLHRPIIVAHAVPTSGTLHFTATVMVSLKQDIVEVLDHPEVFSVRIYGTKMDEAMGPFMLGRDNTPFNTLEKPYMRRIMKREDFAWITSEVARLAKLALQENTTVGLDSKTGRLYGRLEVVNSLARYVPIHLTGSYAGFPGPDGKTMYAWSRATQDDFFRNIAGDKVVHARAVNTGAEMRVYIQ